MTARECLFLRADLQDDEGKFQSAFRACFLVRQKQVTLVRKSALGTTMTTGRGVRPNRALALYWYQLAYRRGDPIAAHNIGTIWRDEHNVKRVERWFQRAMELGSKDSSLDIAKLFMADNARKAIPYLNQVGSWLGA